MSQPITSPSTAVLQKTYVTYTPPIRQLAQMTLLEAPSLLASSGTTGFRTWEAALHLGSFFCSEKGSRYVSDSNILELGAGTGFLSILCAKGLGANFVLATDGSQEVVSELNTNIALNIRDEGNFIETAVLQWGHALVGGVADFRSQGSTFDLVIGADVVSEMGEVPLVSLCLISQERC